MKLRRWIFAALAALAAAFACTSRTLPLPIAIVGLNDLSRTGFSVDAGLNLLFMTSSDHSELRVLNLNPLLDPRDFIRAPDPIQPLSIPVLNRPVALAHDLTWDVNGMETSGPYLYAMGVADPEISLIGTDPSQLFEYCRLLVGGAVTAIAARAPPQDGGVGPSSLFFATTDGVDGNLWQADLPPPLVTASMTNVLTRVWSGDHYVCTDPAGDGGTAFPARSLASFPSETVVSLLVVPAPDPNAPLWEQGTDPNEPILLAVATHAGTDGGRTFLFDTETFAARQLGFPSPVKKLSTHEQAINSDDAGTIWQGTHIYGVLDESSCANQLSCNGIVSVDTQTGGISEDWSGLQMIPIAIPGSLLQGISVTASNVGAQTAAVLYVPQGSTTANPNEQLSLLGTLSASNGGVYFWDAQHMVPVNGINSPPSIASDSTGTPIIAYGFFDAGVLPIQPGTGVDTASFQLGEGTVLTEEVAVTYQGIFPNVADVPITVLPDGGFAFNAPQGLDWSGVLKVADTVELSACPDELTITGLTATSLTAAPPDGGLSAGCAASTNFTVRAGDPPVGSEPLVVVGQADGYMGRVAFGQSSPSTCGNDWSVATPAGGCFRFPQQGGVTSGQYYFHPPTVLGQISNPQGNALCTGVGGLPCALAFGMEARPTDGSLARDIQYSFQVLSNFQTEFITVDPRVGTGFQLPGALAYDAVLQRLYVSYPAADGVIEVAPIAITPNLPNYLNLPVYR